MSTGIEPWVTQATEAAAQLPIVVDDPVAQRFRVHRSAMTSPRYTGPRSSGSSAKSWLYVGHESEIPEPGDFVRRPVGGRPIFMVRGVKTGNVNVFHNTCTHRGALVCRQDSGNAKVFQCFYHAWTFDTEGRLEGVPGPRRLRRRAELRRVGAQAGGAGGVLPRALCSPASTRTSPTW